MSGADKAKNKRQELGGMAKEAVGKFTGDKSTEAEGKRGQVKANLKDAGEKLKEAGEKLKEAGEKVKEAGEKVGEIVEEAGEKVKEAGEKVTGIFKK
ncbi:MAG: CsbD family protein [Mycobacterium sp.]|uniref:CsbD family protein n=1 Tax=Mycobacterium sp. TaxID=1785 RepID=UPI003F9E72AC